MQNATSSKKRKRKTQGSNEPTGLQYWRQAAETQNVPHNPKQNLVTTRQLENLKQVNTTDLSNPSANEPIFKDENKSTSTVAKDQKVRQQNSDKAIVKNTIESTPVAQNHPGSSGQPIRPGISGKPIRPGISGQPIRPGISGQPIRPGISGQPIRPGISGQPIRPGISGQPIRPGISGQPIRSVASGQPIRPVASGQLIRPGVSGQTIPPVNSGQLIRPVASGQPIRPGIPGPAIRPVISGQTIPPVISGQPVRPGKLNITKNHPKLNLKKKVASAHPPNKLNSNLINITNNPEPVPKFKPLQEVKFKPLQEVVNPIPMTNINNSKQVPQPTTKQRILAQNTNKSIITLVGQKRENTANQQKKILKFQMKMKLMQQEKLRQAQAVPIVNNVPNDPGTVNVFSNPNVGFANAPGMGFGMDPQTPFATQNPIGIQHPMGVPQPVGVPNPVEIQQNSVGDPNRSFTPPYIPGAAGKLNKTDKRNKPRTLPASSNMHQNNSVSIPLTPVPTTTPKQPELVETVFQMNHDRSLTPPINQKLSNPSKQLIPPKPIRVQSGRGQKYPLEAYGYAYPRGIPRSFLVQQQHADYPHAIDHVGQIWPSYAANPPMPVPPVDSPMNPFADTGDDSDMPQPYSPSELYNDIDLPMGADYDDPDSPEHSQSGTKRLSAFHRLGPQTQPKKPKLTISVTVNEDQEVREVVDETEEQEQEITPVHLREDILLSDDEVVKKYLKIWPWKKNVIVRKNVTVRNSKTVMMLESEQMEEIYNRETLFLQVTVRGYPPSWKKEDVIDTLLENIRGYSFIPCFIEFNREECKFLTHRCRSALLSLHKCGFIIRKDKVELTITIGQTELTLTHLDFVPRLVLRKRLMTCSDESVMDLSAFTLKEDISHFIYFPLNRLTNQMELVEMLHSEAAWSHLTELNLSHNRITSLDGFELEQTVPRLKHLNLSYNCLEKITSLLKCRSLPLKSIHLEGNPLCRNYIDPDQYVKVVKMLFSSVTTIDDVPIRVKGQMPKFHRNYCPADAAQIADKFLQVYFALLDEDIDHREQLIDMYESTANLTITYNYKLAFSPIYRCFKSLFIHARQLEEGRVDIIKGSAAIVKTITSWPHMEHDPFTFTVDVIYHSGSTTIIRIDGILKLTRETLAEDEHLLAFSRTVVLHTKNTVEYKIQAETLYWSNPVGDYARSAFAITTVKTKQYPKIDSTTDEELQKELLKIFMTLTTMNKKVSERCLELKKWNLREALDHFTKLWKLDNLESLTKEVL